MNSYDAKLISCKIKEDSDDKFTLTTTLKNSLFRMKF